MWHGTLQTRIRTSAFKCIPGLLEGIIFPVAWLKSILFEQPLERLADTLCSLRYPECIFAFDFYETHSFHKARIWQVLKPKQHELMRFAM